MFTVHLIDQSTELPACGSFSENMDSELSKVDCKECLQARIDQINKELKEIGDDGSKEKKEDPSA